MPSAASSPKRTPKTPLEKALAALRKAGGRYPLYPSVLGRNGMTHFTVRASKRSTGPARPSWAKVGNTWKPRAAQKYTSARAQISGKNALLPNTPAGQYGLGTIRKGPTGLMYQVVADRVAGGHKYRRTRDWGLLG